MCVELCCRQKSVPATLKDLRARLTTSGSCILEPKVKKYFEEVPAGIRDEALRDFIKAFTTQTKLIKEGKRKQFEMHFKCKKEMTQESIVIRHQDIGKNKNGEVRFFPRIWKEVLQTHKEKLPNEIKHDCRLIMTKDEKFYLAIPIDKPVVPKQQRNNIVALDPGVRKFQTTYDTEGNCYIIGEEDRLKLDKLAKLAQSLRDGNKTVWINGEQAIRKAKNAKERTGLLKAASRIETKIKNKLSDLHRKTAKFLCTTYDKVIIPEFQTQQMAEKKNAAGQYVRKIGKETTRQMIRWGHYRFRELLRAKGEETGTEIVIGTEEYTSKTCGRCQKRNNQMKGEKEMNCVYCEYKMDRDINAARNIMILNLLK